MKIRLIGIFCLLSLTVQAQKAAIEQTVKDYFSLMQEQKISEALDAEHPDLLNMVGKETYLKQYEQMLNDANMKVSFGTMTIIEVSDIKAHDTSKYALLNYQFVMHYELLQKEAQTRDIVANTLKAQFGEGYSREGDKVTVTANREMFVVTEPDFEGWRILDYEKGMRMLLVNIIPEVVLIHFNK